MQPATLNIVLYLSILFMTVNFLVGLTVYFDQRKNITNKLFFGVVSTGVASLLFELASLYSSNPFWVNLAHRAGAAVGIIVVTFLFFFMYYFPRKNENYTPPIKTIIVISALIFIIGLTPLAFNVEILPDGSQKIGFGAGYGIYITYFIIIIAGAIYNTVSKRKQLSKSELISNNLIMIGFAVTAVVIALLQTLIPAILGNRLSVHFSFLGIIFFLVPITYAMMRQGLFNIRVVTAEVLTYTIWLMILVRILFATSFQERIMESGLLVFIVVVGVLLIRSIIKEVEQRKVLVKRELELKKANIRLRGLDRAKTQFVSIAAHQLRTPLSAIKWSLSMIIRGEMGFLTNEQKKFLTKSYSSNERMIRLINNLLNISRIEAKKLRYKFVSYQLENLLDIILSDFSGNIKRKHIIIKVHKSKKPLPRVRIDPERIRTVLQNLLDNAIKYTHQKGTITIELEQKDKQAQVSIKDTGIGISESQQEFIFNQFFRADNAIKEVPDGSGLGLFIIKEIVNYHGGKIWFESKENKGSIFYFTVPFAPSMPQQ